MNTTEPSAIHRAVRLMGSQLNLARQLQVTPVTVNQWLRPAGAKNARPIPPKQCVRIEHVTGGAVTRKDLRPDDYGEIWPELQGDFILLEKLRCTLASIERKLQDVPDDPNFLFLKQFAEAEIVTLESVMPQTMESDAAMAPMLQAGLEKSEAALADNPADRLASLIKRNRTQALAEIAAHPQPTTEPAQAGA